MLWFFVSRFCKTLCLPYKCFWSVLFLFILLLQEHFKGWWRKLAQFPKLGWLYEWGTFWAGKLCSAVTNRLESCSAVLGLGPGAQNILSQSETSPGALVSGVGAVPAVVLPYWSTTPISQPGFMHSSLDCNTDLYQLLYLSCCTMFPQAVF